MSDADHTALSLARIQGGVITYTQADDLGFSRSQIGHRLTSGRWVSVARLGYRLFDAPDDLDILMAATSLLPRAVVSFESAAVLHGMPGIESDELHVSTHSRTTHAFPGVVVHRCHDLGATHIDFIGRMPATTIERTIVDLAAVTTRKRLGWIASKLLDDGRMDPGLLEQTASDVARRGKPGTAVMREVIEDLDIGTGPSPLEQRGRALLATSSILPEPENEFPLPWAPHRRFDDAFPDRCLAIEWDSFRFHGQRDSFEVDRQRDRDALMHGWRVLRFTWRDVTQRPDATLSAVETAYQALAS